MLNTISAILQAAAASPEKRTIAVAAAHDRDVLEAVKEARRGGIAQAVLTGRGEEIRQILRSLEEDPADYAILEGDSDGQCAALAVAEVRAGRANFLMKGLLGTADLMRAVIDRDNGLRTGRLISHVMLYEVPGRPMLALTDGGMNTFPDLDKKAEILENAARVLQALGYEEIYPACVCGAEVVNPKVSSTVEARALSEMTERWAPYHMQVYGPVGLDLAVSEAACRHKHFDAPGAGRADILLVPTYEVGNGIGKAMSLFGGAQNAGIILGAKVPIVLVSRADSAESKLASIALGAVTAGKV